MIKSVLKAQFISPPNFISKRKSSKGAIGKGHRFEKLFNQHVIDSFPGARTKVGPWIEYEETPGKPCYAQPDLLVYLPEGVIIFEAKLTQTLLGDAQLLHLYFPLLSKITGGKVWLVQGFMNIVLPDRREETDLFAVTSSHPPGTIIDFHWIPPLNAKVRRKKVT